MIDAVEMIIRQPGHPDRVVRLQEGGTRLGRAEDNDIVLSDVGVSRRHAKVVVAPSSVRIEDLGSGNGTYSGGKRCESHVLQNGDEVMIDPFVLIFRIRGAAGPQIDDTASGPVARLDVVQGEGLTDSAFGIGAQGVTLGRSETRDVVIPDPASSRHHCTIFPQDGRFYLRDMGSANGVTVNGSRVQETALVDGDRVRIGNTEFRFVVGDSTKVAGSTPTGVGWHDEVEQSGHSLSLPIPLETTNYVTSPGATALQRLIPMAFGGILAFVVLFLVVIVLGAGLFVLKQHNATVAVKASPPVWTLDLPDDGAPVPPVPELFTQGIAAMNKGDRRVALERFYRSLIADPGNPSAERLAYIAGEFMLLDTMEPALGEGVEAREATDARRERLLANRRFRWARNGLVEEFRDDPVVREAMDWGLSEREQALQVRLAEAQELVAGRDAVQGVAIYRQVLAQAQDPTIQRSARSGLALAERELARKVAPPWRRGVAAEAAGETAVAIQAYTEVRAIDPDNPSARLRLERLEAR